MEVIMKTRTVKLIQIVALLLCFFTANSFAMTHVVMFGGSVGSAYSPSSFNAKVGDTVKWEGSFSVHPLGSTSIPANAASFQMTSGSTFSYVITVVGTYNYHCTVHLFTGSFTATAATLNITQIPVSQGQFSMNVGSIQGKNMVRFSVPNAGLVKLQMFDMSGREMSTILNEPLSAGPHQIGFGPLPAGIYSIRLSNEGNAISRTMQFLR
jgi:plastocyanin